MYSLNRSTRKNKRYMVKTPKGKTIHFGAKGGSTYIDHGDLKKRENYIKRHKALGTENWEDPNTAGFWSRWFLWEKENLPSAIEFLAKNGIKVKLEF